MQVLAWMISVVLALYIGYQWRGINLAIKSLQESLVQKLDRKKPEPEAKSMVFDPYDIQQQIKYEHEQRMKKLNPELQDD